MTRTSTSHIANLITPDYAIEHSSPEASSVRVASDAMAASVWWLHPTTLFLAVVFGTLLPAMAMSSRSYAVYGTAKYLNAESLALGVLACLAVACGVFIGGHTGGEPRQMSARVRRALVPWFYLSAGLTLFGYAAWVGNGLANGLSPGQVVQMLDDADDQAWSDLKFEVFQTVPGITTCTQFGLLAVMLGCLVRRRDSRLAMPLLAAILAVSALCVFVVSERLALVEVVVLMGLVLLRTRYLASPRTPAAQLVLSLAPVVGIVMLIALFGVAEYFRSWRFYRNEFDSLANFTLSRLGGYYSTGHNNGAMVWSTNGSWPLPYHTLEWLWRFPFFDRTSFSYESLAGVHPLQAHNALLERWGSLEFNNPGGLFCPTLDFGVFGGACFWLAFGLMAGRLYQSFLIGSLSGLLFYPFFVLTILEVPRFLYLTNVRPFPALALSLVVLYLVSARRGVANAH